MDEANVERPAALPGNRQDEPPRRGKSWKIILIALGAIILLALCALPFVRVDYEVTVNDKVIAANKASGVQAVELYGREEYAAAVAMAEEATKNGDALAHYVLGLAYEFGNGVEKNGEKMMVHFTKTAEGGNSWGYARIGIAYATGQLIEKDYGRAFANFTAAAGKDNPMAHYWLAVMHQRGMGVPVDAEKALSHANEALRVNKGEEPKLAGHIHECIGRIYQAHGGEDGAKRAYEHFGLALKEGNLSVANDMGVMCFEGSGTARDPRKGIEFFTLAAKEGDAQALFNLGVLHYKGEYAEVNYAAAREYFLRANRAGHVDAGYVLGVMYVNGEGVERDTAKALEYLRPVAENGNAKARELIALITSEG